MAQEGQSKDGEVSLSEKKSDPSLSEGGLSSKACDDQQGADEQGPTTSSGHTEQQLPPGRSDGSRRRFGLWSWPLSKRATAFSGATLACGAATVYQLVQPVEKQNRFLLFTPLPPGQSWIRAIDTVVARTSDVGSKLATALLYVLEKGFGVLEFVMDNTVLFLTAELFSLCCFGGTLALTFYGKMWWREYMHPEQAGKKSIVSVEVSTEKGSGDSSQTSVNVSLSVDQARLVEELPNLLRGKARSSSESEEEKEEQPEERVDPLWAAPLPAQILTFAALTSAPLHWLTTHIFFASVKYSWPSCVTWAKIWLGHTGLVIAGTVCFELWCGGIARMFTPESYYDKK